MTGAILCAAVLETAVLVSLLYSMSRSYCIYFLWTGLLAFFLPCVVVGQNAEYVGEDKAVYCLLACASLLFFPAGYIIIRTILRGKIRDQRAIQVQPHPQAHYTCTCTK